MKYLSVHIDAAAILASSTAMSKQEIFTTLAEKAAGSYDLDAQMVLDRLNDRESLGSTGFGGSVAIPHARIKQLDHSVGLFIRLAHPVAFDAHDGQDVDLVFGLLSPEQGSADHLKALAEISRFLRNESVVSKLRGANSEDALYVLLTGQQDQQAA
ncbi:PTS sugar transporter subunit IIA [Parasphingorhabdus cellanae]|uniref:PTS sugar transporter subunit IIA n=1 Tax=Parasphingorhabdus cellanae TaxID=2806553 RepID=A0ABX7T3T5_9SPHN|nr:PTS sugar transporter subunit IIA [Parasphingorhabdus cellanae]QTD54747.1 PTS sugar transporter subunit IIA [Parasphingorhabdus cellanae]